MQYKDVPILMYHDISNHDSPWCVSPESFAEQMQFLHAQGYKAISLEELKKGLEEGEVTEEKLVIITFDDGRLGVYTHAFPVLQKYGFSATLYIVPQWINETKAPSSESYSQFLTWEQVGELSKRGFSIGSHTQSHQNLAALDEKMILSELEAADRLIEQKTGTKVQHFSYPYGKYTEKALEVVKQRYQTAVTVQKGFSRQPGAYARQWVLRNTFFETFQKLLQQQKISLCMIAKNEEALLGHCLQSVRGLVDEIIVVDTGSTDKTKEIASAFGAKIYDFVWCDDFAAARNAALQHAAGDWILVLDADEALDAESAEKIRNAVGERAADAYYLLQLHHTNMYVTHPDFVPFEDNQFKGFFPCEVLRLFKNSKDIYFEFCVHETIQFSVLRTHKKIAKLPAAIHHYHELKGRESVIKKQKYYSDLSFKNIREHPLYAKSYNDIAIYYNSIGDQEKAYDYCKMAAELEPENIEYLLHLSYRLRDFGKVAEAIEVLQKAAFIREDERVLRSLGYNYHLLKDYRGALKAYKKALELGSVQSGLLQQQIKCLQEELSKDGQ
ncbi:polysaccharide deacetylase family protein [Candidatus Woesearchaeota archaeon]|nr:polysaccharide deacetylase family protein [Candidatus Woesearchaeota archaeon]